MTSQDIDIIVRFEEPLDTHGIRETNEEAFETRAEADLVDALRDVEGILSLVAAVGGSVIGHVLFTPVSLGPSTKVRIAGLGPMAVRPGHQRKGVGGRLVRAGLEACRQAGYSAVVLVGHPEYYPRFGFVPADTKGLTCEFPVPREVFMAIELETGVLSGVSGQVRFRKEFTLV